MVHHYLCVDGAIRRSSEPGGVPHVAAAAAASTSSRPATAPSTVYAAVAPFPSPMRPTAAALQQPSGDTNAGRGAEAALLGSPTPPLLRSASAEAARRAVAWEVPLDSSAASPLLSSPPRPGRRSQALGTPPRSPVRAGSGVVVSRHSAAAEAVVGGCDPPAWSALVRQDSPPVPHLAAAWPATSAEAATPPRAPLPAAGERPPAGGTQSPPPLPSTAAESPPQPLLAPPAAESPQLTALRRRLAAAVARAQQSGSSLDDALASPAQSGGRPLWADAGSTPGSSVAWGASSPSTGSEGRQQRQAADVQVEDGGRALSSAFDDLSMDGGSLRSSYTRDSPGRSQQSDVFCNPLWND